MAGLRGVVDIWKDAVERLLHPQAMFARRRTGIHCAPYAPASRIRVGQMSREHSIGSVDGSKP